MGLRDRTGFSVLVHRPRSDEVRRAVASCRILVMIASTTCAHYLTLRRNQMLRFSLQPIRVYIIVVTALSKTQLLSAKAIVGIGKMTCRLMEANDAAALIGRRFGHKCLMFTFPSTDSSIESVQNLTALFHQSHIALPPCSSVPCAQSLQLLIGLLSLDSYVLG